MDDFMGASPRATPPVISRRRSKLASDATGVVFAIVLPMSLTGGFVFDSIDTESHTAAATVLSMCTCLDSSTGRRSHTMPFRVRLGFDGGEQTLSLSPELFARVSPGDTVGIVYRQHPLLPQRDIERLYPEQTPSGHGETLKGI